LRGDDFEAYYRRWLETPQPAAVIAALTAGLAEGSVIAEVCEEDGVAVGFLAMGFSDIDGYDLRVAEISDIAVTPARQRQGIGTMQLKRAARLAREHRVHLLRADIGAPNAASRALHQRAGFEAVRLLYEKRLI